VIGIRAVSLSLNLSLSDNYISRNANGDLSGNIALDPDKGNVVQPITPKRFSNLSNLTAFLENSEEDLTKM
jgi:hypothetical protein